MRSRWSQPQRRCCRSCRTARERALGMVAQAKTALPELPDAQRAALELVADGVVDRYS